jgi:hypothetical protein
MSINHKKIVTGTQDPTKQISVNEWNDEHILVSHSVELAHLSTTGTPSATTFLAGDGEWKTPTGSGDAELTGSAKFTIFSDTTVTPTTYHVRDNRTGQISVTYTDTALAIMATLNGLTAGRSSPETVELVGVFTFSGTTNLPIIVPSYTRLNMSNASLTYSGSSDLFSSSQTTSSTHIVVEGGVYTGAYATNAGRFFHFYRITGLRMSNMHFNNGVNSAIKLEWINASRVYQTILENITISGFTVEALSFVNCESMYVNNVFIFGTSRNGSTVITNAGGNWNVFNNISISPTLSNTEQRIQYGISNNSQYCIFSNVRIISTVLSVGILNKSSQVKIVNCLVQNVAGNGIETVSSTQITNTTVDGCSGTGIVLSGSNIIIGGCIITNNGLNGILATSDTVVSFYNSNIMQCGFYANGKSGTTYSAITLNNVLDLQISNCGFTDATASTQQYGILEVGGSNYNLITNNVFRNMVVGAYSIAGSGTKVLNSFVNRVFTP